MKTLIIAILTILGLSAKAENFEKILGYTYNDSGIELQVMTGGCTSKSSFRVQRFITNDRLSFGFQRVAYDGCLALIPYGTKINFSYGELGILPSQSFQIINKLATSRRGFNIRDHIVE
jgi:hypothetical protein